MKIFHPEVLSKAGLRIDARKNSNASPTPLHVHHGVELVYVYSGAGTTAIDGTIYPITKGTVCLIPEGLTHHYTTEHPFRFYNILFGFDVFSPPELAELRALPMMTSLFFDAGKNGSRTLSLMPTQHLLFEFTAENLIHEVGAPNVFSLVRAKALVKELLILIARKAQEPRQAFCARPSRSFIRMLGFVHEHYTEKVSLGQVAAAGGLSEKYASVVFQESAGKSFVDYLTQLRLDMAKHLLKTSDAPIIEIAFRCGFNDASYFTLQFKRDTHQTPRQFRHQAITKSL